MHLPNNVLKGISRLRLSWMIVFFSLILLVLGYLVFFSKESGQEIKTSEQAFFSVRQGALMIDVTQAGTIRPREQIILKNEVEGQTVILFLIDEGTEVKKGDLLVELDASQLEDQRVNQQIQVINAEATFINGRENLEVVKNQALADVDQATLDLEFARQDLIQYQEGEYPKLEKEAKAKITLAEETLTNAKNTFEWSKKIYEEKYISETELKRDELAWQKVRLDLDLANDALDLLQNFTVKRRMAELESNLRQTTMALERVKRKVSADIAQAEAKLKASQAEYQQQQDKLDKITVQIGKTKIYAPMEGTVIYATSTKINWRSSEEPLDEGQAVRERQELIHLPTTSSYNAEVKIHESRLEKIRIGLPVRITIDALPDRTFTGTVASIAPLPDPTSTFMNPDLKVYNSVIHIDGNGQGLRNGMSCQAEIIIDQFDNAIYVPVQAVIQQNGKPTVFVVRDNRFIVRQVKIGMDNNRMVHVLEGLQPGENVLLAPPLTEAAKTSQDMIPTEGNTQETLATRQVGSTIESDKQRSKGLKNMTPEQREAFGKKPKNGNGTNRQPKD
ncbi:RND family efflux transporter, MFP subunit [Desulfocapsa sulfexigens DSM 10523]|uniref:RND family efflux transporter, MFP subunit n=1 Tax=Desulfocapsa sulfexigens (strain DSM 10523 / SB164P1) TaxID=1167006 RepID=M1PQN0_DESSD|nr:efflux RND transporter periplasmic adaptor subunit [Desulfocapsa sulfexigens]AGF78711.1 RND family efflux transporter, MFP subunit [Desulfocapsa sulfexigens DSM 10523]